MFSFWLKLPSRSFSTANMSSECRHKRLHFNCWWPSYKSRIASTMASLPRWMREHSLWNACGNTVMLHTIFTVYRYSYDEIESRQDCACHCLSMTRLHRHVSTWRKNARVSACHAMHLSQERFELFLGNSNEVALMQVRVVFFLTNRILPQVPVSGWKMVINVHRLGEVGVPSCEKIQ